MGLLSPELTVEVPINEYPTTESFAEALTRFGGMAKRADLLAAMSTEDEAMLLYDMDVEGLGCSASSSTSRWPTAASPGCARSTIRRPCERRFNLIA